MTVLLIDHQRARFFDSASTPGGLEEGAHLEPKDPHGFLRHLEHRKEADYHGQRVPEADEFYERIAGRLKGSSSIVLVGDATGKSSAMRYFLAYLKAEAQGDRGSHRRHRGCRLVEHHAGRDRGNRATSLTNGK